MKAMEPGPWWMRTSDYATGTILELKVPFQDTAMVLSAPAPPADTLAHF